MSESSTASSGRTSVFVEVAFFRSSRQYVPSKLPSSIRSILDPHSGQGKCFASRPSAHSRHSPAWRHGCSRVSRAASRQTTHVLFCSIRPAFSKSSRAFSISPAAWYSPARTLYARASSGQSPMAFVQSATASSTLASSLCADARERYAKGQSGLCLMASVKSSKASSSRASCSRPSPRPWYARAKSGWASKPSE